MPALERNCTADCMDTYLSNNSDWVNVETVISTSAGQIAVAPDRWNASGPKTAGATSNTNWTISR